MGGPFASPAYVVKLTFQAEEVGGGFFKLTNRTNG
ncbi:hypothetical protein SAMN04488564_1226 [Lentzea waywayandensis]|uniref:Uncharacterized protein n=1 Tax=Lentzea waywayandensis TaxID=84724 RepID=A0A1I6FJ31_9PSEU|nr:hypothetical protein SAMN04488564_1226 [Lentzea waywayandensis]